jgi:predicted SnoaL-like aldol condensation-catalyzing enzyme
VFITPRGVRRGKDGVRVAFTELFTALPVVKWDLPTQIFEGDLLFMEWTAMSASAGGDGRHHDLRLHRRRHLCADRALHR